MRPSLRTPDQLRTIKFTRQFTCYAEGSVLTEYGNTKVLCNASVVSGVPRFLKGSGQGWITAEYGMLPRATADRTDREAVKGKQGGRTIEIQRLIGRALRAMVDLAVLGENTLTIDCDVIQADGGTRTAAISGGCVALIDALSQFSKKITLTKKPWHCLIAAVSVGIYQGMPVLDLDYKEDSNAHTDMNIIMTDQGRFVELQGTAEREAFSMNELTAMLDLACHGIAQIHAQQKEALGWVGCGV